MPTAWASITASLATNTTCKRLHVLLLIDDLQWCDQETLEWLHFLLRFDPMARLLVIGCAREEELPPHHPLRTFLLHLLGTMRVTEIPLEPLDAAEAAKLASQVAKRELEMDEGLHLYHETGDIPCSWLK